MSTLAAGVKNMRHLFKATTLAVVVATLPTSFVQAARHSHQHRAVEMQFDIGNTGASTAALVPGLGDPANANNQGISDARLHRIDFALNEPGKLGLNQIDAAVPEPSTWVMIGVGAVLLAAVQRFRAKR